MAGQIHLAPPHSQPVDWSGMPIPENHDLRIHLAPTWLEKWDGPDRDSTRDNVISEDEIADSRLQIAGSIEPSLPTAKSAIAALKASDPVTAPEIAPRPARTCHCHRCGGDMIRSHVRRYERPLTFFGIKPFRCADCQRRRWRR